MGKNSPEAKSKKPPSSPALSNDMIDPDHPIPMDWSAASKITLTTLTGEKVNLAEACGIIQPASSTSPPPATSRLVILFMRQAYCATCPAFLNLFAHLKPLLKVRGVRCIFISCERTIEEVSLFIKHFAFYLRQGASEDGLMPFPGELYLDPKRESYKFFGIGHMTVAPLFKLAIKTTLMDLMGRFRTQSASGNPRLLGDGSKKQMSGYLAGETLNFTWHEMGASNGKFFEPEMYQSSGIGIVDKGKLVYRFTVETADMLLPCSTSEFARIAVQDATLPEDAVPHFGQILSRFVEDATSKEQSGKLDNDTIKLGDVLGVGVTSKVYKSRWLGVDVAVKYLTGFAKMEENVVEETTQSFSYEVAMLMGLRHKNIVKMMGFGADGDNLFVVMEFVSHGTLFHNLAASDRPFSARLRKSILLDVASGMEYLHGINPPFLHFDLKSLNVLLETDGTAKIADFGISRQESKKICAVEEKDVYRGYGTLQWMGPEHIRRCETNEVVPSSTKWDVYSFAIIMWEVATRRKPWQGVPRAVIMQKVLNGERPPIPSAPNSQWDWRFIDLLEFCWHSNPRKRPEFRTIRKTIASARFTMPCEERVAAAASSSAGQ